MVAVAVLQHRGGILVGNGTLSRRQFLVLDELLLPLAVAAGSASSMNIRIVSAMALDLLLKVLVTDCYHGALRPVGAAVDTLALLVHLRSIALCPDEDNVALVDASVVRTTV